VLTTNQKGLTAETAVTAECIRLDLGVAKPIDDERYDLILDLRPRLLRVQCKWASLQDGGSSSRASIPIAAGRTA
jgi:PD-(D/E)XK endonuclease